MGTLVGFFTLGEPITLATASCIIDAMLDVLLVRFVPDTFIKIGGALTAMALPLLLVTILGSPAQTGFVVAATSIRTPFEMLPGRFIFGTVEVTVVSALRCGVDRSLSW